MIKCKIHTVKQHKESEINESDENMSRDGKSANPESKNTDLTASRDTMNEKNTNSQSNIANNGNEKAVN